MSNSESIAGQVQRAWNVLGQMSDAVLAIDFDRIVILWNRGAERLYGLREDEILGRPVEFGFRCECLGSERAESMFDSVQEVGFWTGEHRHIRRDGRELYVESQVSAYVDADGKMLGYLGVIRDLTEKRKRELERESLLRERERELRETHRIAGVGSWRWIRASDEVTWSEEVYRLFGWTLGTPAPRYMSLLQLYVPESAARLHAAVERALTTGEPYELDLEIRLPDGQGRWITARGEVDGWAGGAPAGLRGTLHEITERKRTEERLMLSESRYRSLVQATCDIAWTANEKGDPFGDMPGWEEFTGQTHKEITGFGWEAAIHPGDRARTTRVWIEAMATGKPLHLEQRLRRHDGIYRLMAIRAVPVRDASGTIVEWVGMHTDVTEQRELGAALQESQSRFQKLFEADLMGICFPDRFGAFHEANEEFLRIVGYTREELRADKVRWDTMTPPEYADLDRSHIAEASQRGSCTPYEKEYIRKDGVRVPILCGYALLDGSEDEYVAFVMDLSLQKRAEEAVRASEARFRVLTESLPQLIWSTDRAGLTTYCNRRLLDYWGLPPEKALEQAFTDFLHPEDRARTLEHWQLCLQTGDEYSSEYRMQRHDGAYRCFLSRAVPVRNEAGEITLWLGSSTDIHEQKLAEETLRRSEKLATTGRFAANIAHEINNPLTAVTNSLYLALTSSGLDPVTRGYLELADQELARVTQLTTQTLRFHTQSSAAEWADLCEMTDSVLGLFAPRLRACTIAVQKEFQTRERLNCFGGELRQVLTNLIGNALDATPPGGRLRIRIANGRLWHGPAGGALGLKIIVADTGCGISAEGKTRILWVAEGTVKKHYGRITVRSRTETAPGESRNHGTVVAVFCPFT